MLALQAPVYGAIVIHVLRLKAIKVVSVSCGGCFWAL